MFKRYQRALLGISLALLVMGMPAYAVKIFKVSNFGGAHQIWFEAEAYDERIPDTDQFFPVTGGNNAPKAPGGAYGEAITRAGGAGGRIAWTFDISKAGGKGGDWYFWGRLINPSNQSDYMLVLDDAGDKKIPDVPPFPGGDQVPPFDNADDRIFEADTAAWGWDGGAREGHTKELQDGENTMYIFHRQGDASRFLDVFVWTDNSSYRPTDADYEDAKEMESTGQAVEPAGKLATVWGQIKTIR